MIIATHIQELIEQAIEGTDEFIVEVNISSGNRISVSMDSDSGLSIDRCVAISRVIEGSLDREKEDFELKVSSPGVGQPLQLERQYAKNIGRTVAIVTNEGQQVEGELKSVEEAEILISTRKKEKKEIGKGRIWVETEHRFPITDIKETKVLVSFK